MSLDLPDEDTREDSDEIYLRRDDGVITLRGIFLKLLQNAQFWELHNVRGTLPLECLDFDLNLINSRISIIFVKPDCTTLFLLFYCRWGRALAH